MSNKLEPEQRRKVFAKNLQKELDKRQLSRQELARLIGVSYSTVCEWMLGNKTPRMDKVTKLEKLFNVGLSDLFDEEHPTDQQVDEVSEERREFLQFIDSVPDAELDRLKRMILLALKRDD